MSLPLSIGPINPRCRNTFPHQLDQRFRNTVLEKFKSHISLATLGVHLEHLVVFKPSSMSLSMSSMSRLGGVLFLHLDDLLVGLAAQQAVHQVDGEGEDHGLVLLGADAVQSLKEGKSTSYTLSKIKNEDHMTLSKLLHSLGRSTCRYRR